jgi:hypothetical protein
LFLKTIFVTFACAMVAAAAPPGHAAARESAEPQRWISQHAQRTKSAELPAARQQVTGDIDGDGRDDVAVLYTLKAKAKPHAERRYLALFKNSANKQGSARYITHLAVGGPGLREVNRVTILKRTIVLEVLNHAPGDAACCPSRPGVRRYRLSEGKLVLVKEELRK